MIRHAVAVAVVVCLSPSGLSAQTTQFTVNAASADVHRGPSTGSPVIGTALRGAVLKVTRELGSWVRISWPAAPDGIGYVHLSTGRIGNFSTPPPNQTAGPAAGPATTSVTSRAGQPPPPAPSPATTGAQEGRAIVAAQLSPIGSGSIPHLVGLGGRMGGSTLGFGASARASVGSRFGVQFEVSRYSLTSTVGQQRLVSFEFAPSVIYSLPDRVTDYVWVRPYVGAGVSVYRSTLRAAAPSPGVAVTDNDLGRQAFGGVEVSLASVPRFTVSADYGYRWAPAPFDGFDLGGRGLSVSGHWYVK